MLFVEFVVNCYNVIYHLPKLVKMKYFVSEALIEVLSQYYYRSSLRKNGVLFMEMCFYCTVVAQEQELEQELIA